MRKITTVIVRVFLFFSLFPNGVFAEENSWEFGVMPENESIISENTNGIPENEEELPENESWEEESFSDEWESDSWEGTCSFEEDDSSYESDSEEKTEENLEKEEKSEEPDEKWENDEISIDVEQEEHNQTVDDEFESNDAFWKNDEEENENDQKKNEKSTSLRWVVNENGDEILSEDENTSWSENDGWNENESGGILPNLKITEVYIRSSDEWIEITNIWDEDFEGDFVLEWVKKSNWNRTWENIFIKAHSSSIFTNGTVDFKQWIMVSNQNPAFVISDTKKDPIYLHFSWSVIDSFPINANGTNDPNKKKKYSFQRNLETDEIIAWISTKIKTESENGTWNETWTWENPDTPGTWEILTWTVETGTNLTWVNNDTARLVISEVWYDDCMEEDYCDVIVNQKEWIEISNIGTWDFLWSFTLSGEVFEVANAITFEGMYIPAGGFLILANDPTFLSLNEGILWLGLDYPRLLIPDDQAIHVELWRDEKKEDSFVVDKERVVKKDDYLMSFHKVMKTSQGIVTQAITHDSQNIPTPLQANPWVVYSDSDTEMIDCSKPKTTTPPNPDPDPEEPDEPEESSGSECVEDLMEISEIFAWGERYDPYVEMLLHKDLPKKYKNLILSGSILQNQIVINLKESTENYEFSDLQKNSRILLTQKPWQLAEAGLLTLLLHEDFEIKSFNGNLELRWDDGQSRQLFDKILISTWIYEKSIYKTEKVNVCGVVFDKVDDFSPGFSEDVLTYFSPTSKFNIKTVETVKYVWWGGWWCSCPTKEQLCGKQETIEETWDSLKHSLDNEGEHSLSWNQETLSGPSDFSSFSSKIKIIDLQYLSPEAITLQSFLTYDVDLSQKSFYLKSSTSTTKKYLTWTLKSFSVDTFEKNFGFPDAWACISLYSWDSQLDQYCYTKPVKEKEEKDQTVSEKEEKKEEKIDASSYTLKIIDVLYDPEGTDTNNEEITIQNLSSTPVNLSKIKMKVNSTNKKLSWELEIWETKTLKGTFWFPNSTKDNADVVISLFYEDKIFDTYSYNPNKKVENQTWTVKVYSVLDGDTFRFRKEDGTLQSVRLLWADAPESNKTRFRTTECFGLEAKKYLTELLKNKNVRLEFDDSQEQIDLYGRYVAYVYLDGELINQKMISEGYAKEYTFKTAYQFQKEFQKSEQDARTHQKGLRSSQTCGTSLADEPEVREKDYDKLHIKITNLLYDPEGTDKNKEAFALSVDASEFSGTEIDFSDNFSFQIFPRGEFATWTTKNKSLSDLWLQTIQPTMDFTGDFSFPNSKATCVSLKYKEYTFDTYCYNPTSDLLEKENENLIIPQVKILSVVPNPSGKDTDKEEITLFRERNDEEPLELDLSQDFSLLINGKTKKKISGILIPSQEITVKWNFSLPNSASCVSLQKGDHLLDTFCYEKPKEGTIFKQNNERIEQIQTEDLSLLKKISLVKKGDQLCVVYNKVTFTCKKIPNSTTEQDKKLLSFQNNLLSELQTYLKNDYSLLFYQSDLKDYFSLYSTVKKQIKAWNQNYERNGTPIKITDVSQIFKKQYNQSVDEYLLDKFVSLLPKEFVSSYQSEREKYLDSLWE